ncbi:MAG: DinB family protein [Brumimicrobium sp.]
MGYKFKAMNGISAEKLLEKLTDITIANKEFVQKKCTHLGNNQLNWRPTESSWNILEVLSHLNSYSNYYHKLILYKIRHSKHKEPKEIFVSSQLGKSAWRSMKLGKANNIKKKFRAPRQFNPTINSSLVDKDAVNIFIDQQETLLRILEKSAFANLKKIKVPISISKVIRLRLGDILQFIIYHNERHIQQVKNIMAHNNFPKKK